MCQFFEYIKFVSVSDCIASTFTSILLSFWFSLMRSLSDMVMLISLKLSYSKHLLLRLCERSGNRLLVLQNLKVASQSSYERWSYAQCNYLFLFIIQARSPKCTAIFFMKKHVVPRFDPMVKQTYHVLWEQQERGNTDTSSQAGNVLEHRHSLQNKNEEPHSRG